MKKTRPTEGDLRAYADALDHGAQTYQEIAFELWDRHGINADVHHLHDGLAIRMRRVTLNDDGTKDTFSFLGSPHSKRWAALYVALLELIDKIDEIPDQEVA